MSAAVILPIGLAIAINSALFSVLDGLLFRPLPFHESNQLVAIEYRRDGARPPELQYQPALAPQRAALLARIAASPLLVARAQAGLSQFFDTGEARDNGVEATGIDTNFFPLLGLAPALGSGFQVDDERSPALRSLTSETPLPVIIGHDLWVQRYGGHQDVLGVHELAGRRVRVVGVMGPGVKFPGDTNVWAPVASTRSFPPTYVRLAPRATVAQLAASLPELTVKPLRDAIRPGDSRSLAVIFAASVLLLLVAWVQVAALVFSSAIGRLHEIGVQLAIGCGRARLVRQFALENLLLAGAAFALAWVVSRPLTMFIVGILPADLSHGQYLVPDTRTFLFACAMSLVGLGLLTVLPFSVIRRAAPIMLLRGHFGEMPISAERRRHLLLIGQMTLTALLLYLSGLSVHSFVRAVTLDYGFEAEHVLVFTPPSWGYTLGYTAGPAEARRAYDEAKRKIQLSYESLRDVPGVVAAARFFTAPLGVHVVNMPPPAEVTYFDGRPLTGVYARSNSTDDDFVRALGATVVAGASFDSPEFAGRENVAVINEALARALSPTVNVLGQEVRLGVVGHELRTLYFRGRIIGVIKDLVDSPAVPPDPEFFVSTRQRYFATDLIAIRATPSVEAALPAIRTTLERVWGPLPPRQFGYMRDELRSVLTPYRGQSTLMSLIAVFCLPLAAVGLTGALLHSVRVRTKETAIRVALGADPVAIRRAVVRRSLGAVGIGILLGTALGAMAGRLIAHQLFRVEAIDVWTMAAVAGGLLVLAWAAALLPARRAASIEPAAALRQA